MRFCEPVRGRTGWALYLLEPCHWGLRGHWKDWVEGGRHLEGVFVTVFFPMPWFFAVVSELRWVLFLFRDLHFVGVKNEEF